MYYRDGGCVVGVVNDWDRATVLSASAPPNTDRTGTIPFMALELLSNSKMVHLYRHDASRAAKKAEAEYRTTSNSGSGSRKRGSELLGT